MNIFVDTQDMEERYEEELYKEYLENQNKEMKERIDKAIEYIKNYLPNYDFDHSNLERLLEILGEE